MELVEDDAADALQEGVVLQLGEEDPLGAEEDLGLRARLAVEPDVVADLLPQLPPVLLRHPPGSSPGGDPPRLEDHHGAQPRAEERRRHPGRLARTRRRHEHRHAPVPGGVKDLLEDVLDGQRRLIVLLTHRGPGLSPSLPGRPRGPAPPACRLVSEIGVPQP